MMQLQFVLLAVVAGMASALQGTINAALARSTGLGATLIINTVVVMIGSVGLWAAMGAGTTFFPPRTPWTLYLGGVCGFLIIAAMAIVFPRIGAAYTIALMVGGQCIAALLIDHYGWLGMPTQALTLQRLLGVALIGAGVVAVRL